MTYDCGGRFIFTVIYGLLILSFKPLDICWATFSTPLFTSKNAIVSPPRRHLLSPLLWGLTGPRHTSSVSRKPHAPFGPTLAYSSWKRPGSASWTRLAGTGTGGDIELVEGDAAPAFLRDQGGLAIGDNLVAEEEYVLGPVETARFLQSDGSIHLDVTNTSNTDLAGTIEAYGIK